MNKFLKISCAWALSAISLVFTLVPESFFEECKLLKDVSDEANIIINRIFTFFTVFVFVLIFHAIFNCIRRSINLKGHGYRIRIEYGDILKKTNCKKVINFDECFTTRVGDAPSDIKPTSICGQYILSNQIHNLLDLIEKAQLKPAKSKSRFQSKERYESGRLVPNGEYLLMAFAKLDNAGRGWFFSRNDYLDCLSTLWDEIDKYYGLMDVCIPILGSGITRFEDKLLTQQELLDIIVASYKLSPHKIKPPYQLRIVCRKDDDFSIYRIGETL